MNALIRLGCFALMLVGEGALGQSNLPPCQGKDESGWNDCFGSSTNRWRDEYVGEWKDGKRNGKGTFYLADCYEYKGDWKNDKADGKGILKF